MYDSIIVLARYLEPDGSLNRAGESRVEKGIRLLEEGVASVLIFSGGVNPQLHKGHKRTQARAMLEYALNLGLDKQRVLLEENSHHTIGNIYFTKREILEPRNWKRNIVVTSEFHLERADYLARKVLGDGYLTEFSAAQNGLSERELDAEAGSEREGLIFYKGRLGPICDGTDLEIEKFLCEYYPEYRNSIRSLSV